MLARHAASQVLLHHKANLIGNSQPAGGAELGCWLDYPLLGKGGVKIYVNSKYGLGKLHLGSEREAVMTRRELRIHMIFIFAANFTSYLSDS